MAALPYLSSPGNIEKALKGIKTAAVPDKVSQDFVKTILKVPGGSGDQMTSFLKKLGLTAPNGGPSELYRKFRNPASSGAAIATAIRLAYAPLFKRNEFAHELPEGELSGLIVEETGLASDSALVKLTASCFKHLKAFASFNADEAPEALPALADPPAQQRPPASDEQERPSRRYSGGMGLNLGYTINLNLPATADPLVFDAIFKSLKEHLLKDDDA